MSLHGCQPLGHVITISTGLSQPNSSDRKWTLALLLIPCLHCPPRDGIPGFGRKVLPLPLVASASGDTIPASVALIASYSLTQSPWSLGSLLSPSRLTLDLPALALR